MKIPFSPPYIDANVINEVVDSLKSGWITTGPKVKALEEEISKLKTIEQLKEKKIEEYKTDLLQTEQKELDEIGLQIFKRNVR